MKEKEVRRLTDKPEKKYTMSIFRFVSLVTIALLLFFYIKYEYNDQGIYENNDQCITKEHKEVKHTSIPIIDHVLDDEYHVVQSSITGEQKVKKKGTHFTWFNKVTKYLISKSYYFTESNPITVRFKDGIKTEIYGILKYRLPDDPKTRIRLHKIFGSQDSLEMDLIEPSLYRALNKVGMNYVLNDAWHNYRLTFQDSVFTELTKLINKEGITLTSCNIKAFKTPETYKALETSSRKAYKQLVEAQMLHHRLLQKQTQAQAYTNKKLVEAGLTPIEKTKGE